MFSYWGCGGARMKVFEGQKAYCRQTSFQSGLNACHGAWRPLCPPAKAGQMQLVCTLFHVRTPTPSERGTNMQISGTLREIRIGPPQSFLPHFKGDR